MMNIHRVAIISGEQNLNIISRLQIIKATYTESIGHTKNNTADIYTATLLARHNTDTSIQIRVLVNASTNS